jgi:hypothetical protein
MATATGTTRTAPARHETLRLPRTTGALSGLLIIALGIWGGLIPFVGPYFHYSFGGDQTWHFTMQRLWLNILPGALAVIGGFMLLRASSRIGGLIAGWVAVIAGAWFAVGPAVALLWDHTIYAIGAPNGGQTRRMLEWVGYFYGLGVVIVGLSAFAMGRYFSRPRVAEQVAVVAADAAEAERVHHARESAAVADAPRERAAVADAPAERAAVADVPARDVPVSETRAADAPTERAMPAERAPVTDAPVSDTRAVDVPTEAAPARATYAPADTTATETTGSRRRSGGLVGRFRRR